VTARGSNETSTSFFCEWCNLRNRVNSDFVSSSVSILHSWVVGVFMGHKILKTNKKIEPWVNEKRYSAQLLTVALMSQPFGFFRLPLNISLYKSMLLLLMASSKVMVIIWGTSFAGIAPGMVVPSSEQKQSGRTQTAGSHGGARFGSVSASAQWKMNSN
jgi:hypothetical protein